jgi:secreted trypsin-like serine protease
MVLAGQNPSDDYIAAGGETGHDTCQGDSGGPLLYYDKNSKQYVQSGITSFGSNTQGLNAISNASTITCARRGDVGFYYRADMELDWIQSMTLIPMEQWSIKGLWQDTPSAGSKMAVRSSGASTLNHFLVNWLR